MPLYQGDLILEEADSSEDDDEEIEKINNEIVKRESTRVGELNLTSLHR